MITTTVQWLHKSAQFSQLESEWRELLDNSDCDTIFLTWEWLYTWWQHLADGRKLALLVVRQQDRLIAIAPMAVRRADYRHLRPFRALELLGNGYAGSDYLSLIVRRGYETEAIDAMNASLIKRRLAIEWSNTSRGARIMTEAALGLRKAGYITTRITQHFSPFVNLENHNWQTLMAQPGKPGLTRFNKKLRKLNTDFVVTFDRTRTQTALPDDLGTLVSLHLKRWSGRGGSNALSEPTLRGFHEQFSRIALQNDWLRLYILRLDGQAAAGVYAFHYKGRTSYYQAGFDPTFNRYSVGHLALGLSIQQALEEKSLEYDLLHGEEEYKYAWFDDERELVRLNAYPPGLRGRLCERLIYGRQGLKKMLLQQPTSRGRLAPDAAV